MEKSALRGAYLCLPVMPCFIPLTVAVLPDAFYLLYVGGASVTVGIVE